MTPGQERSVDFCVKYLIKLGIPREKIIIGAAFYGRIYEEVENLNNGLYQPGKSIGSVAYKNLRTEFPTDRGYEYHWDDIAKAPYIYHPSRKIFITYDDKRSVELKTKYVIDNKLGGIMFWQLRNDMYADGLLDTIDKVKKNYTLSIK
jgi:chitinase